MLWYLWSYKISTHPRLVDHMNNRHTLHTHHFFSIVWIPSKEARSSSAPRKDCVSPGAVTPSRFTPVKKRFVSESCKSFQLHDLMEWVDHYMLNHAKSCAQFYGWRCESLTFADIQRHGKRHDTKSDDDDDDDDDFDAGCRDSVPEDGEGLRKNT